MSPREFQLARQPRRHQEETTSSSSEDPTTTTAVAVAVVVCDRPYLPHVVVRVVDDNDDDDGASSSTASVKMAVAKVLLELVQLHHQKATQLDHPTTTNGGSSTSTSYNGNDSIDNDEYCYSRMCPKWMVEPVGGGVTNRLFRVANIDPADLRATLSANKDVQHKVGEDAAAAAAAEAPENSLVGSSLSSLPLFNASASSPFSVLVRVFGAEGMIDRDVETTYFAQLSSQGLAPLYYGRVANARIEGWCDSMRPLQVQELNVPDMRTGIAVEMAKLHALFRVESGGTDDGNESSAEDNQHEQVVLWTQLDEWCTSAVDFFRKDPSVIMKSAVASTTDPSLLPIESMPSELQWIRQWIDTNNGGRELEIAFCHNDVLAANVLWDDQNRNIQLIDFEYGGLNYVAFDIANHWNEYAGGPPHTSVPNYNWFPSASDQTEFVKAYLSARKQIEMRKPTASGSASMDADVDAVPLNDDDDAVQQLLTDVRAFVLVNHLYWGLWAVNQAYTEGCDEYDYATYACQRFQQYGIVKKDMMIG